MPVLLGPVDLTDRSRFRFREFPPTEDRQRVMGPRPNTTQGAVLSRSHLLSVGRHFLIACLGMNYQDARDRYDEIRAVLAETRTYWSTKGRSGTNWQLSRSIGNQTTPDVWTVFDGSWLETDLELLALHDTGQAVIMARLDLMCWEGALS